MITIFVKSSDCPIKVVRRWVHVEIKVGYRIITKSDKSCTRAAQAHVESSHEALNKFNLPVVRSVAYGIRHVKKKSRVCISAFHLSCRWR